MLKESFPHNKNTSVLNNSLSPIQRSRQLHTDSLSFPLSRSTFINWLKELPSEERYLALRIHSPNLTLEFRDLCRKTSIFEKPENPESKVEASDKPKNFAFAIQSFLDSLTLISHQGFLDCLGFDYGFVGCPQKVYEMFSTITKHYNLKPCKLEDQTGAESDQLTGWVLKTVRIIMQELRSKMSNGWDSQEEVRVEKLEKKEFGSFWNNADDEQRRKFLYLGCQKMSHLSDKLSVQYGCDVDCYELRHQIDELLTTESKTLCNKLFKWRAKKGNLSMCSYYCHLFNLWRQMNAKRRGLENSKETREKKVEKTEKVQRQKGERKGCKKRRNKKKKDKSADASSNETNETEVKEVKEEINAGEIVENKLEDDLEEWTNSISESANKLHEARVKAYRRVMEFFGIFSVKTKLFGSCACGIAIDSSDVDMAIGESILDFFPYRDSRKQKMSDAFHYVSSTLESFPWVSNIKVITTAAIPIIKFTVDTQIEVSEEIFSWETQQLLSEPLAVEAKVNIDLTIETSEEQKSQHLGVISTQTIKKWIAEIPSLSPITVLLKHQLAKNSLNQTYTGGLNTYSLVVLIVAFIRSHDLVASTQVSQVLEKLLNFYGSEFDERAFRVDLTSKEIFVRKDKQGKDQMQRADLQIRDPLSPQKNMTRNGYQFAEIKKLFRRLQDSSFQAARTQMTQLIENDINLCRKLSGDKNSYRTQPQFSRNYFFSL